jgi:hypothetical protein
VETGIYRKIEGRTGVGMFYQFLLLAREHTTGEQAVVYIPLRVEPEWAGTVRPCYMPRAAFERKFESRSASSISAATSMYVGEGLP